jgi:DNA polymerase/3'-5' exonuclease PolX
MMKKQSTLFPQDAIKIIAEMDLKDAQKIAAQVKETVETVCVQIEIAGSIRRQKSKIHDIDFVVVTKSDREWHRINEKLKQLKAKPNCAGNSVIKSYVPCQDGLFQVDFYRAKPSTFGIHLLVRTGSADHNMWLAGYAFSKGMRLKYSEGLIKDGAVIAGEDEKAVFATLALKYPLPSERETVDGKPVWMITQQYTASCHKPN